MKIDFEQISECDIEGFKGGKGLLHAHNYVDADCKIMLHRLEGGATTGLHKHEINCEIVYVVSGEATVHCDGQTEKIVAGQVHYCPRGHSHYMENHSDEPMTYFAVVPELK